MSRAALRVVCVVLLAAFAAGAVFAQALAPEPRHRDITRKITAIMASYNFQHRALDDALSRDVFSRFLDTLDAGKLYLLREDVDRFAVHRDLLDDYLRHGEVAAAYEFFEVYRRRFNERMEHAIALVDGGFDFDLDEEWRYQRDDAEWAAGRAQLDEIWRKRIKNDFLELRLDGVTDAEARDMLAQRYRSRMRSYAQLKTDEVYQWFINSYTTSVDPHTSYLPPRSSEDFNIDMSLSLQGIGAVLQADNEYTKVLELVQGGPAAAGGELRPGDRITGVAQGQEAVVNVVGWRLDDVVRLIRGPKGSLVRLEILPAKNALRGPKKIIAIVRDKIKLTGRAADKQILHTDGEAGARKIGVVRLPIFYHDFRGQHSGGEDYNSASRDVERLLGELKAEGVDGVVLDLRGNSGGALTEAVALTGLFIDQGPVVQVEEANGRLKTEHDRDPGVAWEGPLAVLVDRYSASASEIFASAIQDHRRGLVVGESTYGKGTVQNLLPLGGRDSGQLKITFAQFFRVNGGSTQFRGVIPDLRLPTDDGGDHGERTLDNALPWSAINPVLQQPPADAREDFARAVEQTVQLHRARLRSDAGLLLVRAENEQIRRNREKTTLSLRESERRREREERENAERERRERYFATVDGESGGAGDHSGDASDGSGGDSDDSGGDGDDPADFDVILLRETATALADFAELYRGPLIPGFSAAQ